VGRITSFLVALLTLAMFGPAPAVAADLPPALSMDPCGGMGQVVHLPGGLVACTHGPDPAPASVDVSIAPSVAELGRRAGAAMEAGAGAGDTTGGVVSGAATGTVPCIGDGVSGKRVEAIYAYDASGVSDYATVAPMIQAWAGAADQVFDISAAKTGGSRHLRWHHDDTCSPIVDEVALSATAIGDFEAMANELFIAGYDRYDRRYVVWVDTEDHYCGIALNLVDDRPGQDNLLNGNPATGFGLFARIDRPCWGLEAPELSVEAHEIEHTLGAVQPSAPNSSSTPDTFYGHCIDEWDTMCYADGSPKALVYRCAASQERVFDCQDNDYFNTKPSAGSYLATHWNTANSSFLVTVDPIAGFLDIGSSGFTGDIAWLAASGITRGCSADQERFCPTADVTRGQMAAFLSRGLALPPTTTDYFTDDETSIFENDINRLAAAGITRGCTATEFCPDLTITREQMAAFLARALKLAPATTDYFTDDETSIFENDINRAAEADITHGCSATTYCPKVLVTREQMAAFLHRGLG
jgi:S-layer homology domain